MVKRQPHRSNRSRRLSPPSRYVRDNTGNDSVNFEVGPIDGKSQAEISHDVEPPRLDDEAYFDPDTDQPLRFSVLDLLTICSFAAVGLSAARWLPQGLFVGLVGVAAFAAVVIATIVKPSSRYTRLLLWGGITIYFGAALGTIAAHLSDRKKHAERPAPAVAPTVAPAVAPAFEPAQE